MSTITAILEPAADGTLHVPVPVELRHRKFRVEAVEVADARAEDERKTRLREAMKQLRSLNPFKGITDPVAWQREMREDVKLPGRD